MKLIVKNKKYEITDAELQVMNVLWKSEPLTLNEIVNQLSFKEIKNKSTIKTLLYRLVDKGSVKSSASENKKENIFKTAISQEQYLKKANENFLDKLYNGSTNKLLLNFVEDKKITKKDLQELIDLMKGIMDMLFIQKIFTNILYMAFIASFVAIIILLLRKIFDKKISPMWKFAMWILLLISLIIPFRITLYSSNEQLNIIGNFTNYLERIKINFTYNYCGKVLTYIWLVGMAIFSTIYIFNAIKMKLKIGKEEIKEERILKILDEVKQSLKIKRNIKLINQKNKIVPCIYGILQPKILLTKEILEKPDEVLKYIFMHELAHYKRKDTFLNFILLLITFVYWFNPILWFCFKQIRQDMELKADELVIKNIPHNKDKEYAKALVSLLPISEEEKITNRLLYVTDSKKNMERRRRHRLLSIWHTNRINNI